jgi:hypothetical protein
MAVLNRASWELQQTEFGNLYPRYVQNTMKVASILAIGDGRKEVSMKDFEQAQAFMRCSITNTDTKVGAHMAGNNFERQQKRLMKHINKNGGRVSMREAYRHMHLYRREMEELVHTMTLSGLVDTDVEANGVEWLVLV